MPFLGELGANVKYALPIALPGSRGGPDFPDGAYSQDDCYSDNIVVFGQGKMPLIPPVGRLPQDVREVSNWNITQTGSSSWKATASVIRCGVRKQCMESLYDRAAKTWYCPTLADPCGEADQPACTPVPTNARWTWTDDFVQGRRKVLATAEGDPVFDPATEPEPDAEVSSGGMEGYLPLVLIGAGVLVLALVLRR